MSDVVAQKERHRRCLRRVNDRGPTYTEEHRHACEVRYVLAMPDKQARRAYLDGVEKKRGKQAADMLRDDVLKAWKDRS